MADADPEDALYAAPPDSFVAARDALARELREAGDRAGARRVRALRRPTRAAWAINVAVRAQPDAARALADAAADLGAAQRELLDGGPPERLRTAVARVDAADAALLEALPVADPPTLEKVRQTLRAAAIDADALVEVTSGRLLRERVASGFGDLAGFLAPPPAQPDAAARGRAPAGAADAAQTAERERAEREAEHARAEAETARRAAEEARRARQQRAREEETAAEAAVAAARGALHEADAALARRRDELDAAEARLAHAAHEREQADAD